MSLLDALKTQVLDVLAPYGWASLFKKHGLDITVASKKIADELTRVLPIQRMIPGFQDFALGGYRAIEPGRPGLSLLYHALASAHVNPGTSNSCEMPTLEQMEIVENYIYSVANRTIASFNDPVIAVFAYQYRDADHTTHRQHADLAFSRTGIARVGNLEYAYDPLIRGFDPKPAKDESGFRALPARYGVFIAERRPQPPDGSVMRGVTLDGSLTFLFPMHKLFEGDECLFSQNEDGTLKPIRIPKLKYCERHVNEKLAKIHLPQDGQNPGYVVPMSKPKFDLTKPPFVRDSAKGDRFVTLKSVGSSVLVVPVHQPLAETATQRVDGVDELVRFRVPKRMDVTVGGRSNRYWSTFELPATSAGRAAPEYANIRQEVVKQGKKWVIVDLNQAGVTEFEQKWLNGGYEAAHFVDHTCDGALTIKPLKGIGVPIHCAYSLVTAIDYLPFVDQMAIEEWIEKRQGRQIGLSDTAKQFPQGGPQPLSDGRFEGSLATGELRFTRQLPNCTLPHPSVPDQSAFSLADPSNYTATAVVGYPAVGGSVSRVGSTTRATSWLPDGASDVFAPGWDVSQHELNHQVMYVSYGLGSPFPEDAKLCAALNSFWPAVAPDSSRTYGFRPRPPFHRTGSALRTSIPLTDSELGYHRDHPRVQHKEVKEQRGWDGDFGPSLLTIDDQRWVDASNPMRADQTRAAIDELLGFQGLDQVDTQQFLRRIEVLNWCRKQFETEANWWLVTFEIVPNWAQWKSVILPRADAKLQGEGIILVFADVGLGDEVGDPPLRRRFPVKETFEIQLSNLQDFTNLNALLAGTEKPVAFHRRNMEPFRQG